MANDKKFIAKNGIQGLDASVFTSITTSGKVGVGTASPVAGLDVLGTSGYTGTIHNHAYANGEGVRIFGNEATLDILGKDSGDHSSSVYFRNGTEGFAWINDPDSDSFQLRSFTSTGNDFNAHGAGNAVSNLVSILDIGKTGNVGIGTDAPGEKLDVNGDVRVRGSGSTMAGTTVANASLLVGSSTSGIGIDTNEIIAAGDGLYLGSLSGFSPAIFREGTTEHMRINTGGNVGIGTATPSSELHIEKAITGDNSQLRISNGAGATLRIGITGNGTNEHAHIKTNSAENLEFHIGQAANSTSPNVVFKSGGNVGIGDATPTNGYLTIRGASTSGTANSHIMLTGDGATVGEGPQIAFSESGVASNWVGASIGFERTASGGIGNLIFSTRRSTGDANTLATEAMRIDSSGNVGIGTTNPDHPLVVKSSSGGSTVKLIGRSADNISSLSFANAGETATNYIQGNSSFIRARADSGFHFRKGGTPVTTDSSGFTIQGLNVGIGTATPRRQLHVLGGTGDANTTTVRFGAATNTDTNHSPKIELPETVDGNADMIYGFSITGDGNSTNNLLFRGHNNSTGGTVALSIDRDTANVGIGTNDPGDDKLYVTGGRSRLEVQNVPNGVISSNASTVIEAIEAQLQIIGVDSGSWASNFTLTNAPASGNNKHWTMHHTPASHPTVSNALQFNYLATNTVGNIGGDGTGAAAETKMTIANTGNVGIATETPSNVLHVHGADSGITVSAAASDRPHIRLVNGTAEMLRLSVNNLYGAIGDSSNSQRYMVFKNDFIGTNTQTAPNAQIHIGTAAAEGDATNPALQIGGANTYRLGFYTQAELGVIDAANGDSGLAIHTKTIGEAVRINADGEVGIGTNNPFGTIHTRADNTRIIFAPGATGANLAAQHRLEFWEGVPTDANSADANYAIEYDGTPNYGGDGALLFRGAGSASNQVYAGINRQGTSFFGIQGPTPRVGIGTTNPGFKLSVDNGTSDGGIFKLYNEEVGLNVSVNGGVGDYTNSTRMVVFNATRFDTGTSPKLRLGGQGGIEFAADSNNVRMVLNTSGNVGIATNSPGHRLHVVGDNALRLHSTTNGVGVHINFSDHASASYGQNGTLEYVHSDTQSFGSGNAFKFFGSESALTLHIAGDVKATNDVTAYYSDPRLKDFHGNITGALDKVNSLGGYYFTENARAKELGYTNDNMQVGVNAQEVEAVLPEVVTLAAVDSPENYKTVKYDKMVPLLIEAIKELTEQNMEMKQRLDKLEGEA